MEHVTGGNATGTGFSFFAPHLKPPYLRAYLWRDDAVGVGVKFEANRMPSRFLHSRTHENHQVLVRDRLTISESDQHEPLADFWCLLSFRGERNKRSHRG